ncbi:hypothetical protein B0H15DRAFT_801197 [Mycena belliarum]|uniref:Uncharacterized protein n=1 Tax=Mycena belliarum TaxID=1033014 RepID=A0AAD6U252_9AGAR|nr:hypothetical protein B0H15DRAFT_801197 [Mycena belliae]
MALTRATLAYKAAAPATAVPGPTANPASVPLARPKTYSLAISDTYRGRLLELDNENHERVTGVAEGRSYARQVVKKVTFQWWTENGAEPDTMDVLAPSHPYFHPVHSNDMITLYGVDKTMFDTFYPADNIWKISSVSTPPQYRSRGVKTGIGMPLGAQLRLNHNNQIDLTSPSGPSTPIHQCQHFDISISSSFTVNSLSIPPWLLSVPSFIVVWLIIGIIAVWLIGSEFTFWLRFIWHPSLHSLILISHIPFNFGLSYSTGIISVWLVSSEFTFWLCSLCFIWRHGLRSLVLISRIPFSFSLRAPSDALLRGIITVATKGPSMTGWPYKHTRPMAAGFLLLDQMGGTPRSRPQDFLTVFGLPFVKNTYNDNRKVWDNACIGGINPEQLIAENNGGSWRSFRTKWK